MGTRLYVYLLGNFRLVYDNVPISAVASARMQELLTYLILHRHAAQSRQYLSFLFWPDSSEKQARTNLRQLLHHLHISLPAAEQYIMSTAKTIQWNVEASYTLDVAQFEQLLLLARKANKADVRKEFYKQAIDLYGDDLLKTCYNHWIAAHRERLQREFTSALEEIIQLLETKRCYAAALSYGNQLLQTDPLHEPAYRLLMRLHAANNDRAGALHVYLKCVEVFRKELQVEPDKETKAIYNRLLVNENAQPETKDLPAGAIYQEHWPLVGRYQEWKALQTYWEQSLTGAKQLAIIEGEPGIGKTRLANELLNYVKRQGYSLANTRCYEAAGTLSYAPITDLLNTQSIRSHLSKLDVVWLSELTRLLPGLLIDFPNLIHPGPLTENWQRQKFFEAISRAFTADGKAKVLFIDDLQWCDQETLSWLHYFLHVENRAKVLITGTMRSWEYALNEPLKKLLRDLQTERLLLRLKLEPLDEQETLLLAKEVAIELKNQQANRNLYKETEGNPLFIVESIRNVELETDVKTNFLSNNDTPLAISPKVNEVIAARFAKLSSEAREIMNLSAVIGRKFSFDVLKNASNMVERDVIYALEELMQHYVIREHPSGDFDFSHDKLREVAYGGMSYTRKRWLHRIVAETIEKLHGGYLSKYSSGLAYHYDYGGIVEKAIYYYSEAAKNSQEIFANNEAVTFLKRAIALLQELPRSNDINRLEISLQTNLAITSAHLNGYGSEEIYQAYERVKILSKWLDETSNDRLLRILALNRIVNSDFSFSNDIGLELLRRAKLKNNQLLLIEAHYILGVTQEWLGNYNEAKIHLTHVLNLYDPQQSHTHIQLYGNDPAIICRIRLAISLLALGHTEEAQLLGTESLQAAINCGHPFSLAYVQHWLSFLYNLQGKVDETKEQAEASIAYSAKYEFPFWYTLSKMLLGWSIAQQGKREEGCKLMLENLELAQKTGISVTVPYFCCLLAEALADEGKFTQAFHFIEKAEAEIASKGERWLEAEHYRIKGEIILKRNPADKSAAKAAFEQAIQVARQQGAILFEQKAQACLNRIR